VVLFKVCTLTVGTEEIIFLIEKATCLLQVIYLYILTSHVQLKPINHSTILRITSKQICVIYQSTFYFSTMMYTIIKSQEY
jgi:hypothetical protein